MGTLSDQILGQAPAEAPAPAGHQDEGLSREILGSDDSTPLVSSLNLGAKTPPEQAAKVLRLQQQTGLPTDIVNRNPDEVEQHATANQIDHGAFQQDAPTVAAWLAENPLHSAIAFPDLNTLRYQEKLMQNMGANAVKGLRNINLSYIGVKKALGMATPEDARNAAALEKHIAETPDFGITGPIESMPGKMIEQAPLMGASFLASVAAGAAGAAAGGGATAPAGGVGAAPAGATAAMIGGAVPFALSEFGSSYLAYEKLRDEKGQPLDGTVVRGAAAVSGILNGAMMMVPQKMLLSKIPGLGTLSRSGIQALLESPTTRAAVTGYLKSIGEQATAMGALNFMQTMVRGAGADLAKMTSDGSIHTMSPMAILTTLFDPQKLKTAASTVPEGAALGAGFGAAGGAFGFLHEMNRVQEAQANAKAFGNLGKSVESMQMMEHSPEKTREVIGRLASNGPLRYVYAPIASFNQYWQEKGADPRDVAQKIMGSHEAYDEASRTGADIQIPVEKYATTIAPTEHNAFFQNELRSDPKAMNAREAEGHLKTRMAEADKGAQEGSGEEDEPTAKIATDMTQRLKEAGFTQSEAENQAQLYRKYFGTLALRSGEDPYELFKRYAPEVQRSGEARGPDQAVEERAKAMAMAAQTAYEGDRGQFDQWRELLKAGIKAPKEIGGQRDVMDEYNQLPLWMKKKTGRGIDEVRQAAVEAGLHQENDDIFVKLRELRAPQKPGGPEAYRDAASAAMQEEQARLMFQEKQDDLFNVPVESVNERMARYEKEGKESGLDDRAAFKFAIDKLAQEKQPAKPGAGQPTQGEFGGGVSKMGAKGELFQDARKEGGNAGEASPQGRPEQTPTEPGPEDQKGTAPLSEEAVRTVFPGPKSPSLQSITADPVYVKMAQKAAEIVHRYAQERGIAPSHALAEDLFSELHDALGAVRNTEISKRMAVAKEMMAKYPNLEQDFVTLKDQLYSDTTEPYFEKFIKGQKYYQSGPEHLGSIRFGQGAVDINLFKNANLSTFLHESGHLFLKAFGDIAGSGKASQELKADYQKALEFLGVKEDGEIERQHHEKWAKSFETYLMEGKAPSAELRAPFARFRSWLIGVYKNIKDLGITLNPEVRGVFDRLLATREEIAAAENEQGMKPLFPDPRSIGVPDTEAERYLKAVQEAHDSAEEEMTRKMLDDLRRQDGKTYRDRYDAVQEEMERSVDQMKPYIARAVMGKGLLPDGSPLPPGMEGIKLSRDAVVNEFPDIDAKKLRGLFGKDGAHPDDVAALFGFKSGAELLSALQSAPERKAYVQELTEEAMKDRYGDKMRPSELAEAAMTAVHNKDRSEILRKELEYLASDNLAALKGLVRRTARRIPMIEDVRRQAEDIVENKLVREITPDLYRKAEAVASREAVEHLLRGDLDSAFESKQRELLNHELFRAADAAKRDVSARLEDVAALSKDAIRAKIGKAGGDYLERIDDLLDRFDFRKASLKELDSRRDLRDFVAARQAEGYDISMPDKVLNEAYRQHYKEMKYGDLSEVFDSLETIKHLAYLKSKLLANKDGRDFEEVKQSMIGSILENHDVKLTGEKPDFAPTMSGKLIKGLDRVAAEHTKMEFLARLMDGGHYHGPFWKALFQPFNEAANAEGARMRDSITALRGIFDRYTMTERAKFYSKRIHVPEIDNTMNKMSMLATVLNWGTEGNRAALVDGYGWSESQVRAIWKNLDRRDFEVAQAILDHVNSFWDDAAAVQRRQSGLVPEKIPAAPFDVTLASGEVVHMRGGYYPLAYDRSKMRGVDLNTEESINDLFGGQIGSRAMTSHSFMKGRIGSGGNAVRLEMNVLTKHLSDVIHDITHRETVIDAHKLINDPEIKAHIQAAGGTELYRQLGPWLKAIAGDTRVQPMSFLEGLLGGLRSNMTTAEMGLNFTSALIHTSSYLMAARELGPKYSMHGLNDIWGNPAKIMDRWKFISERSEFMKDRQYNLDRDLKDMGRNVNITGVDPGILGQVKAMSPIQKNALFSHFVGMDLAVAMPTWIGAYRKAMDGQLRNVEAGDEKAAIEYADNLVRDTKGSGGVKDLAAIQRGGNFQKLFTTFFSQMSIIGNQFMEAHREFKMDRDFPKLMATATMSWFAPAVMVKLLRGQTPGDDEGWTKWFAKTEAMYPLEGFILMRDFAHFFEYGGRSFEGSPVFNGMETIAKTLYAGGSRAFGDKDEFDGNDLKNAVTGGGYLTGLPTRQAWRSASYLHDWITGEESPDTPMEGAWRSLVGRKAKQ